MRRRLRAHFFEKKYKTKCAQASLSHSTMAVFIDGSCYGSVVQAQVTLYNGSGCAVIGNVATQPSTNVLRKVLIDGLLNGFAFNDDLCYVLFDIEGGPTIPCLDGYFFVQDTLSNANANNGKGYLFRGFKAFRVRGGYSTSFVPWAAAKGAYKFKAARKNVAMPSWAGITKTKTVGAAVIKMNGRAAFVVAGESIVIVRGELPYRDGVDSGKFDYALSTPLDQCMAACTRSNQDDAFLYALLLNNVFKFDTQKLSSVGVNAPKDYLVTS